MLYYFRRVVLLAVLVGLGLPAGLAAQAMTPAEAQYLRHLLDSTRQAVRLAASRSPAQLRFQPAADRWSVAQNLEHLARTERGLFALLQQQVMTTPVADSTARAARMATPPQQLAAGVVADRANRRQAPEMFQPTGEQPTAFWLAQFDSLRQVMDAYLAQPNLPLHDHQLAAFPGNPPMDGYQWLVLLASHTQRHLAQVAEVTASAGYPTEAEAPAPDRKTNRPTGTGKRRKG